MPYEKNSELPASVRSALPEEAQTLWRGAFNGFMSSNSGASEESAFRVAWSAVNKKFKKSGDKWSAKDSAHLDDADYSAQERMAMAKSGEAMPDGSYPIKNRDDLEHAIRAVGRGDSSHVSIRHHIMRRASALGLTNMLPQDWTGGTTHDSDSIELVDTFTLDDVNVRDDGYLTAFVRAARTGIQIYKGRELGRPDLGDVRVYRPPEEVFAPDAMKSFAHRPMTLTHPKRPVTSDNWKKHAVGWTGEQVVRDGEFVRVPMTMADAAAIDAYKRGVKELSMGYSAELVWEPGYTTDGEPYDAVQTAIRANHLAVVPFARGGSDLRIGDDDAFHHERRKVMRKVMIDGIGVEVEDQTAEIINAAAEKHDAVVKDLTAQVQTQTAAAQTATEQAKKAADDLDAAVKTKDAEIATLKQQVTAATPTPAALDAMVREYADARGKARSILGDSVDLSNKTIAEIRRAVVDAKLGETAKGWNDDQVAASFNTLTADVKGGASRLADSLRRPGHQPTNVQDERQKSFDEGVNALQNAWKNGGAAA